MVQQSLSDRIETTILSNLFFNENFTRKALPFIQADYFTNSDEQTLFTEIEKFVENYKNLPTKDTILIELGGRKDLTEEQLKNIKLLVAGANNTQVDLKWPLQPMAQTVESSSWHRCLQIAGSQRSSRTPSPCYRRDHRHPKHRETMHGV